MAESVSDLRDTVVPKSDQLNADDLIPGPVTVRVTDVRRGNKEQPVEIHIEGRQPYKPCKGMRRVLIAAWGVDGKGWVGRSMTLFRNPDVKYGGVAIGGIQISHLSHMERDLSLALTVTRGTRAPFIVRVLADAAPVQPDRAYLAEHPDKEAVRATRRALFGDKHPLAPEDVAQLAAALRKHGTSAAPPVDHPITDPWDGPETNVI